jgi:cell division protease FtsH
MVTEYGMSDRIGLVTYERPRQPMFLPGNFSPSSTYSEEKSAQIDGEISRFIDEAHHRVKKILSEKREVLDRLARLLSEKESVEGDQVRRMLSESGHQMVN